MTRALLDINVLIALFDSDHVHHETAHAWLEAHAEPGWASCPTTQNGFVRVVSQPAYPGAVSVADAVGRLTEATTHPSHRFWPCDLSVTDPSVVNRMRLLGSRQVTDAYLLAVAVQHSGTLATFDRSVPLSAVPGATKVHLTVL